MYCRNCGKEIDEKAVICPHCGVAQKDNLTATLDGIHDSGSLGWGVLGCCLPLVGLILYLVWKDSKPKTALMAGKGALLYVILVALCYFLIITLGFNVAMYI